MRTPVTLNAAQRAADLQRNNPSETGVSEKADLPTAKPEKESKSMNDSATKPNKQAQQLEAARRALAAPTGTPRNATAGVDPLAEVDGAVSTLDPEDIEIYKHNPRTRPNPKREEIKASMIAEGRITNTIMVTRRSPAEKYFPYGGGNTRVSIAQELKREGDTRFDKLTVITRKWPGEAAVISAHLSENDNRGDISFWERAKGVASYKSKFEEENGCALSSTELNKALKKQGLNYGIRMIQNFAFAVEHMHFIGSWLRTDEVNNVLKPLISGIYEIAEKFDKSKEARVALEEIFLMHGQDLESLEASNVAKDPAERKDVVVDLQSLVLDLQTVGAKAIGIEIENLPAALSAVVANPKITAEELASVKAAASDAKLSGQQAPLGGMLGAVGGGATNQQPAASRKSSQVKPANSDADALANFAKRLSDDILALNAVVPISDFIVVESQMPLGFIVEIPSGVQMVDGQALDEEKQDLRTALWSVLAVFTGQFNQELASLCSKDTRWSQALKTSESEMRDVCAAAGLAFKSGVIYTHSLHFARLMGSPVAGTPFVKFLGTVSEYFAAYPAKAQIPYKPLFS